MGDSLHRCLAKVALCAALLASVGCQSAEVAASNPGPQIATPAPRPAPRQVSTASLAKRAVNLGMERLAQNRPRAAAAALRKALALDPLRYEAHHLLGRCHYELGEYALEQVEYLKCLAISPRFAQAWRSLGHARFAVDDLVGAKAAYSRYLELAPRDAAVTYNLAQITEDLGDTAEAKALFTRSRALALPTAR